MKYECRTIKNVSFFPILLGIFFDTLSIELEDFYVSKSIVTIFHSEYWQKNKRAAAIDFTLIYTTHTI